MKIAKYLILPLFVLLISCGGTKTSSQGLNNESFLEIIGTPSMYSNDVDVVVDDNKSFKAKVYKDKVGRMRGEVYAITIGKHLIKIYSENKIIYNQQIFVSSQQTKKIIIP